MIRYTTIDQIFFEIFPSFTVSNKSQIKPPKRISLPVHDPYQGWPKEGYPFKDFLADCYYLLGKELSNLDGMQQLVHHYYLQNGTLDAKGAVERIKKFIT